MSSITRRHRTGAPRSGSSPTAGVSTTSLRTAAPARSSRVSRPLPLAASSPSSDSWPLRTRRCLTCRALLYPRVRWCAASWSVRGSSLWTSPGFSYLADCRFRSKGSSASAASRWWPRLNILRADNTWERSVSTFSSSIGYESHCHGGCLPPVGQRGCGSLKRQIKEAMDTRQ